MLDIDGVTISLWLDGRQVEVDENGVVKEAFKEGHCPVIQAATYRTDLYGLMFTGRKRRQVEYFEPYEDDNVMLFEQAVSIALSASSPAVAYAPAATNSLQLLEFTETGFRQYQVCLVGQNGQFFLCVQLSYEGGLYCQYGELRCPELEQTWWQLAEAIACVPDPAAFPRLNRQLPPPPKTSLKGLPGNTGQVAWYNLASGYGEVETRRNEQIAIRWPKAPIRANGMRYVLAGEIVTFAPFTREDYMRNRTDFELTDVALVTPSPESAA